MQTSVAAIHLCFHGYVPVSPVVVYTTENECILLVCMHALCRRYGDISLNTKAKFYNRCLQFQWYILRPIFCIFF